MGGRFDWEKANRRDRLLREKLSGPLETDSSRTVGGMEPASREPLRMVEIGQGRVRCPYCQVSVGKRRAVKHLKVCPVRRKRGGSIPRALSFLPATVAGPAPAKAPVKPIGPMVRRRAVTLADLQDLYSKVAGSSAATPAEKQIVRSALDVLGRFVDS